MLQRSYRERVEQQDRIHRTLRAVVTATSSLAIIMMLLLVMMTPNQQQSDERFLMILPAHAFQSLVLPKRRRFPLFKTQLNIYAPPGSGYSQPEDEENLLPKTYKPMMAYPGTMRPGTTPENQAFQDLPIGDNDPDPVPWPHFQQIEWHHRWDPPHEHAIPMEEFIEINGRWATPEMEAAMRAGIRRDVRERREQEENAQKETIITDDDDDDDIADEPVSLGDGIFGKLGSDDDRRQGAAAVSPDREEEDEEDDDTFDDDGSLDDFLLGLGLDAELDADIPTEEDAQDDDPASDDDDGPRIKTSSVTTSINVEDDDDLGLDDDDDDEMEDEVPLEDDLGSDALDGEDIFGEGGFDYDDFDGGDLDEW